MDTSWWLALAAVVLLALVATLVDGWGRLPRRRGGRQALQGLAGPQPSEIWWADGHPCLVLATHGEYVTVAKISGKFHDGRSGVIPLPPGAVGDAQGRPGFLETGALLEVPVGDLRRRVGVVDPVLWDQVRHLT